MKSEQSLKSAFGEGLVGGAVDGDKTLVRALRGDATAAFAVWESINNGTADIERALVWLRHVASEVQKEVIDKDAAYSSDSKERAYAALRSIGYKGRTDKNAAIKEHLGLLVGFENIESPGVRTTHRETVTILRNAGLLSDLSSSQAMKLIERIRQENPEL